MRAFEQADKAMREGEKELESDDVENHRLLAARKAIVKAKLLFAPLDSDAAAQEETLTSKTRTAVNSGLLTRLPASLAWRTFELRLRSKWPLQQHSTSSHERRRLCLRRRLSSSIMRSRGSMLKMVAM